MITVAHLNVLMSVQDQATAKLNTMSERVRYIGARMRNAGIGLTIAVAPLAMLFTKVAQDAMQYEQVSNGIRKVSVATGRDIGEVMGIINKHSGEMSSKLETSKGMLKLLSTELTTTQLDDFIQLVKDGAAAMGEDFGTQLTLVTRGFKQLNPNVIDNIGINIRMREIYRKANKEMTKSGNTLANMIDSNDELGEAQKDAMITQILFSEMQRKGGIYTGVYGEYMHTTAGRVAMLHAKLSDLAIDIGTTMLPNIDSLVSSLNDLVDVIKNAPEDIKGAAGDVLFWGTIFGVLSAAVLMFGGNLVWSIGQLTHLGGTIAAASVALWKFITMFAIMPLIIWMGAGVITKFLDMILDAVVYSIALIKIAFKQTEITFMETRRSLAEFLGETENVKNATDRIDELNKEIIELGESAIKSGKMGDDMLNQFYYPWRTLGMEGKWGEDLKWWLGKQFGWGAEGPEFGGGGVVPPESQFSIPQGAQMGNLVINIYTQDGTYGSTINLGQMTSLMERVGDDVVVNAGVAVRTQ